MKRIIIFIIGGLILAGCIIPYEPEIKEGENRMVVEGRITSLPGPYTVTIAYSGRYAKDVSGVPEFITGAYVCINDTEGDCEVLQEISRGTYTSREGGIQGRIGKSYNIEIITQDGKHYGSKPEKMIQPPPIKRIYDLYNPGSLTAGTGFGIYSEFDDPADETNYYKWETAGWYQWSAECWHRTDDFYPFNLMSDKDFNGKRRSGIYLVTIPYNSRLPFVVDAYLLALSPDAYKYLYNMEKQVTISGNIFDSPPSFLRGNIYNQDNPDEITLGYFYVAGVTEYDYAIDRSRLEESPKNQIFLVPSPVYCGDPCNYLCVMYSSGHCGFPPCPPECNSLPGNFYKSPEGWPLDYKACDE